MSYLDDLPDDIVLEILERIPTKNMKNICGSSQRLFHLCTIVRNRLRNEVEPWIRRYSKPEIALVSAAREGNVELVDKLVRYGVDPSWRYWQSYDVAVYNGHTNVAQYLESLHEHQLYSIRKMEEQKQLQQLEEQKRQLEEQEKKLEEQRRLEDQKRRERELDIRVELARYPEKAVKMILEYEDEIKRLEAILVHNGIKF